MTAVLTNVATDAAAQDRIAGRVATSPIDMDRQRVPAAARYGLFFLWITALAAGIALVVYGFGPFFQQRDQHHLMRRFRADVHRSANEATGLAGVTAATMAPEPNTPVGILEVGAVRMQQVVVEGAGATQTRHAPGHVPGSAGLGQPGNSVLVGRRAAFGGPFSSLGTLRPGDKIVVTTTQGQSVYEVASTRQIRLPGARPSSPSVLDKVYGPSRDDRLTLVTASGLLPWNHRSADVVVATLEGTAFAPTPQGGRRDSETGTKGDRSALAAVILALAGYGFGMGASVVIYRRLRSRSAYLLTVAPVVALTVIAAETLGRLLPAWT
ncbi:MAG: sortase [Actinobacteria bacterium]|nr:sortase [Actinomycetota bacterium]